MPQDTSPLPRVEPGRPLAAQFAAARVNQWVGAIEDLRHNVYQASRPGQYEPKALLRLGRVDIGTGDEPTDNRYRVTVVRPKASSAAGDALSVEDEPQIVLAETVTATNTGEPFGTHLVPDGTVVDLIGEAVQGNQITFHWHFCWRVQSVVVRITGNATGGGKYTGKVLAPPTSDIAATGDLAAGDLGSDRHDCLYVNMREVGGSTHKLVTSGDDVYFEGVLFRRNADGTLVVRGYGIQTRACP